MHINISTRISLGHSDYISFCYSLNSVALSMSFLDVPEYLLSCIDKALFLLFKFVYLFSLQNLNIINTLCEIHAKLDIKHCLFSNFLISVNIEVLA